MSIASTWRGEEGGASVAERRSAYPASTADKISARVIEASPDDDVGDAMRALSRGVRRRVTFRRAAVVSCSPPEGFKEPMDELPRFRVSEGLRGTTVAVVVDGRDVVELDDGRSVLARVGEDCRILGWWFRFVDRLRGRRFH